MTGPISTSREFFLWDYDSTLFPLRSNRLMADKYASEILKFIQDENLTKNDGGFQNQHRVFATKRGWILRPTVKLDPVAEFFFYDFVYRNRQLFRKQPSESRRIYGYRIANGEPISILNAYSHFKKATAQYREQYSSYAYFDVAAYFNHIYHHDLVRWFEDSGANSDDVNVFGAFLREVAGGGRSTNCLPQGIYPSKMIGSAFLSFLEHSSRIRSAQTIRMMDDMWLFDDNPNTVISDFLIVQALLAGKSLTINEQKTRILEEHDVTSDLPPNIDEMKAQLLKRRRAALADMSDYGDFEDAQTDDDEELSDLTEEEQEYLLSLLRKDNIQEEDAELVLTLMGDHSSDVVEFIPALFKEFPGLAKRMHYFCGNVKDKTAITSAISSHLSNEEKITEYQLFWFGMTIEDYLLKTPKIGDLLIRLYEHDNATDITKAKILEIPEKKFGLDDIREEQLRTGHSDWLGWSAAVGARVHAKGQRNQLLKYFRKSSAMNRLVGEFVETCF